jgi:hypothetical protein
MPDDDMPQFKNAAVIFRFYVKTPSGSKFEIGAETDESILDGVKTLVKGMLDQQGGPQAMTAQQQLEFAKQTAEQMLADGDIALYESQTQGEAIDVEAEEVKEEEPFKAAFTLYDKQNKRTKDKIFSELKKKLNTPQATRDEIETAMRTMPEGVLYEFIPDL